MNYKNYSNGRENNGRVTNRWHIAKSKSSRRAGRSTLKLVVVWSLFLAVHCRVLAAVRYRCRLPAPGYCRLLDTWQTMGRRHLLLFRQTSSSLSHNCLMTEMLSLLCWQQSTSSHPCLPKCGELPRQRYLTLSNRYLTDYKQNYEQNKYRENIGVTTNFW